MQDNVGSQACSIGEDPEVVAVRSAITGAAVARHRRGRCKGDLRDNNRIEGF